MTFQLHPDLQRDGIPMGRFELCLVMLIDDSAYPWFVLVPERSGIRDTIDLSPSDHRQLWHESYEFGAAILKLFPGDKLNVAALGNMTPQLHVHHVVRKQSDAAWPGVIWGKQPLTPYSDLEVEQIRDRLIQGKIKGFRR